VRKLTLATFVVLAVTVASMAPASARPTPHPLTVTTSSFTTTGDCEGATPLDSKTPVPVTEVVDTVSVTAHGSSVTTVVGTVKVTASNTGRSQTFVDDYRDRPVGNPAEIQDVKGWALVGPGALGGDVSYLDPGKAAIDHYGTATVTSHHAENVCSALGA
jgi:hypothetical protein